MRAWKTWHEADKKTGLSGTLNYSGAGLVHTCRGYHVLNASPNDLS